MPEVNRLVAFSKTKCIGPLRKGEPPRILVFPAAASDYHFVLVLKEDNNGTCHWFTESLDTATSIEFLMEVVR